MTGIAFKGGGHVTKTRCPCCLGVKPPQDPPWRPGDPIVGCETCVAAGCTHVWRDNWHRGDECPRRRHARRLGKAALGRVRIRGAR